MRELPTTSPWQPQGMHLPTCVVMAAAGLVALAIQASGSPWLERAMAGFIRRNSGLQAAGWIAIALCCWLLFAQRKGSQKRSGWERVLRAAAFASGFGIATLAVVLPVHPLVLHLVLHDGRFQGLVAVVICFLGGLCYALAYGLSGQRKRFVPYPLQVLRQQDSYDYTLGKWHPDDWEHGKEGADEWLTWPELGTYCNMLILGSIGSGKTSQVCDPLALQAMGKFPKDPDRQVSMLIIDYKGNQAARYWDWAQQMGRAEDFFVLRPDVLRTGPSGDPVIPEDRYVSFSPLQGHNADFIAGELQEALESTKDQRSPDYFQNVQKEFLTHAMRLLLAQEPKTDLADLQAFAASDGVRKVLLNAPELRTPTLRDSLSYFRDEFGKLSAQDQAGLLRGLASQLTLLTSPTVQSAFCPSRSAARPNLGTWAQSLLERPGIVIYSCPPSQYTLGLSRLLGLLVLKSFQGAMKERSNAAFAGNKTRQVMLLLDEAHAFLNKDLGEFLSLSRESRVTSLLLTQSVSQLPHDYRQLILGGCRSHAALAVNDETARLFEQSFGTTDDLHEMVSFSEAQRSTPMQGSAGTSTGSSSSMSRSYSRKPRPRFSAHVLRHIPTGQGVVHIFDGERQRTACLMETTPWYRLPYYVLDVGKHSALTCAPERLHEFERTRERTLVCKICKKTLTTDWEIQDYRSVLPAIRVMTRKTATTPSVTTGASS